MAAIQLGEPIDAHSVAKTRMFGPCPWMWTAYSCRLSTDLGLGDGIVSTQHMVLV